MKLDMKAFADKLKKCEGEEKTPISDKGVKYLNELMDFYVSGEGSIFIDEIDFDEFDSNDVEEFRNIYNDLWTRMGMANKLFTFFDKVPSKSIKQASVFF